MLGRKHQKENTARQLETYDRSERVSSISHLTGLKQDKNIRWIPVERIIVKEQIRKVFDEEKLKELAASLKEHGQRQPCEVYWSAEEDGFILLSGERRFRAATMAELSEVKCTLLEEAELDEAKKALLQLLENIQREDLTVLEEAMGYWKLQEEHGLSQRDIAARTGKNQSTVSRALKVMNLSEEIREQLSRTNAPRTLVESLVRLKSEEKQQELINRHLNGEVTAEQAQVETSSTSSRGPRKPSTKQVRVKKARGVDLRATGKKKHTNTDYALAVLDWCEDLATDKRAQVDIDEVLKRLDEVTSSVRSKLEIRSAAA